MNGFVRALAPKWFVKIDSVLVLRLVLCKGVPAKDWPASGRLEWDLGLLTAIRASYIGHLTWPVGHLTWRIAPLALAAVTRTQISCYTNHNLTTYFVYFPLTYDRGKLCNKPLVFKEEMFTSIKCINHTLRI